VIDKGAIFMDALDEFFRVWSEPEAWCERCQSSPAIHVVIQDDNHMDGMTITYAYIWDPDSQVQMPVCRSCSQHYIDSLGSSEFQYAEKKPLSLQPGATTNKPPFSWRRSLVALAQGVRGWFKFVRPRQATKTSQNVSPLSRLKG
jgi:hypothetical protein